MSNNYSQEDSQHVPECRHKNRCWHPQCHRSHTRGNLRDVCNLVKLGLECEREVCYFDHDPANEVSSDDEEEKVPHRDCNYGNRCDYGPGCTFAVVAVPVRPVRQKEPMHPPALRIRSHGSSEARAPST